MRASPQTGAANPFKDINGMITIKWILSQALSECVKDGLIPTNPCQYVEMPRRERYEAHFYSAKQMQRLIAALNGEPIQPLVRIAALYGLRRSELLGLKWDSIDFENGVVLIRHTVCKMIVTVEKDKTKNQSSRRSFPMTKEAREIFLQAKAEEEENQRLFGKAYQKMTMFSNGLMATCSPRIM